MYILGLRLASSILLTVSNSLCWATQKLHQLEAEREKDLGTSTSLSDEETWDMNPTAEWIELQEKFPMKTLEVFLDFEDALKNPKVCIDNIM